MSWANPEALLLLLPVLLWLVWRARRTPPAILHARAGVLAGMTRGRGWTSRLLLLLRVMALAALVVAIARPRTGGRMEVVRGDGISIILAVDVSSSMLAEDFLPNNRLEVAKETAKEFIAGRRADQIGMVAFAGEALTQVPLTLDYGVVSVALDRLQPGQLEDGTAIGTALMTATNRLRGAAGRSRVVIMLTDGENNRGSVDPRTAAQAAAALGIRVHTIGIGSEGVAPFPVGRSVFGLRYENRPVRIDEPLLEEIAAVTGGRYQRARDAEALRQTYATIDALERTPIREARTVRHTERYPWPLALAGLVLVLELWVAWRRSPVP